MLKFSIFTLPKIKVNTSSHPKDMEFNECSPEKFMYIS